MSADILYSIMTIVMAAAVISGCGIWIGRKEDREAMKAGRRNEPLRTNVESIRERKLHELRR